MKKKIYTVLVDSKLWTNCIDDMNSEESWAIGGIIFLSRKKAQDFCKNLKEYPDWGNSKFEIIELCQK